MSGFLLYDTEKWKHAVLASPFSGFIYSSVVFPQDTCFMRLPCDSFYLWLTFCVTASKRLSIAAILADFIKYIMVQRKHFLFSIWVRRSLPFSQSAAINKVTMTASILHLVSYKMNYRLDLTALWSLRPVRRHSRDVNAPPGRPTTQKINADAFIGCDHGHKYGNWRNCTHGWRSQKSTGLEDHRS